MAINPTNVQVGICPGCGARIRLQQVTLGEFLVCKECGDELEIVRANPVKLDWAYAEPYEDEDWNDEDWDDDYSNYEDSDDDDYDDYSDWDDD